MSVQRLVGCGSVCLLLSAVVGYAQADDLFESPRATASTFSLSEVEAASSAYPVTTTSCSVPAGDCPCCDAATGWFDELTLFGGLDGSKQPQDFGVNANLGGHVHFNWGLPLSERLGIGVQFGSTLIASDNAVQVHELLGEKTTRFQNFNTVGLFQRTDSGWAWGFVYDWLQEDTYDDFSLGQWRLRGSYDAGPCDQFGVTVNLSDDSDTGVYSGPTPVTVTLRPIDQANFYWRHWWETGTQSTCWLGMASEHSENNAVTGPGNEHNDAFLFGADILAPLNDYLAIYGETNIMLPADTGTVDAFMGIRFFPGGGAKRARRGRYAPLLPVAAPTTFSVDLLQ